MIRVHASLRWLMALVVVCGLIAGSLSLTLAQEPGYPPDASSTPTPGEDSSSSLSGEDTSAASSIGGGSGSAVSSTDEGQGDATPTTQSEEESTVETGEEEQAEGSPTTTEEPDGAIGDDGGDGVNTGEGTPTPEPESSETVEATPTEVTAASVDVSVLVFNCATDPGAAGPVDNPDCSAADGVTVSATADGNALGTQVTGTGGTAGAAAFSVPEASTVVFSEDQSTLPDGFVPLGNGTAQLIAGVADTGIIVNVAEEEMGRVQVSNHQCSTIGEPRTNFVIVGPLALQASSLDCPPVEGTSLTLAGDGGTFSIPTDSDGYWQGFVPAGSYTISNANGSKELVVEANETTIVIVIDFVPGPKGTLVIQRYQCTEGDAGDTTIEVGGGPLNASCFPSDETVEVSSASEEIEPLVIDLGSDGQTSIDLSEGDYVVTDGPSGKDVDVSVDAASTVSVVINGPATGVVSATIHWCSASASAGLNPANWGQWSTTCPVAGAGLTVTLFDGDGNPIATSQTGSDGSIAFNDLVPGTYSLEASSGCALFAGEVDARGGFGVSAGGLVSLVAFGCAAPVDNNPPPDPGTIGGEDPNGPPNVGGDITDDLLNAAGFNTRNLQLNPIMSVSTLPTTGEVEPGSRFQSNWLILFAVAALIAGGFLAGRGRKRFR